MKEDKNNLCQYSNEKSHSHIFSHYARTHLNYKIRHLWHKIENSFLFIALVSFFWLVFKSGSKPSRIIYPCQKAAAANISMFVILIPVLYKEKIEKFLTQNYLLRGLFLSVLIILFLGAYFAVDYYNTGSFDFPFESKTHGKVLPQSEQIKLGAQSKYETVSAAYALSSPHRVITVHNSNSSTWEGSGNPNNYMNQTEIDRMVDIGIMELTGTTSPQYGWRKIIPYTSGQSVAIKVNFNNNWDSSTGYTFNDDSDTSMLNYAAVVNSVIRGLKSIGVPSEEIWITDPSRLVHDQFRERIYDKKVQYYVNENGAPYIGGRPNVFVTGYVSDSSGHASESTVYSEKIKPAKVFVNATYIINIPQLKGHGFKSVGKVTLSLKNNFGSVSYTANARGEAPAHEAKPFAKLLAEINNNPVFRNKTRLILGDGIMGNPNSNTNPPTLWKSFGNKPPETLFFGVDPVATDSIMIDYIRKEGGSKATGLVESYAADLGLGVSESWDNKERYIFIDYHPIDLDKQKFYPIDVNTTAK